MNKKVKRSITLKVTAFLILLAGFITIIFSIRWMSGSGQNGFASNTETSCIQPTQSTIGDDIAFLKPMSSEFDGYETIVQKNFDGTTTRLTIATNTLPPPKFGY